MTDQLLDIVGRAYSVMAQLRNSGVRVLSMEAAGDQAVVEAMQPPKKAREYGPLARAERECYGQDRDGRFAIMAANVRNVRVEWKERVEA